MSSVTLSAVRKSYGGDDVVQGVDIEIANGEFVVVVGPSGCGKSTLLRMIAGLETVTGGDIYIDGARVNDKEPMDRNIAMVFQNYALYPHMSVYDNMAYSLKIARVSKAEIRERVTTAAAMLQLGDYLKRKPRELSGGQRQRVAMGRAIVRKPAVYLFDEPLSNLDAKLRVQMRLEIKALQRKLGVTSIYVTHDQVEAMTLGDRLMVLNDGVVEQFGTPIELYERPSTPFVADFIGSPSMNLIAAKAVQGQVELPGGYRVDTGMPAVDGDIIFGIRPEHLVPDSGGELTMDLGVLEQLGSNTLLHGKLAGTDIDLLASLPGIHTESTLSAALQFRIDVAQLHVFDANSGTRLS